LTPSNPVKVATICLLVLIWGTTWAVIRIGLGSLPPFTGVALRFGLAGLLLLGLAVAMGLRGDRLKVRNRVWAIHGLCTFAGSYGIVYWAEQWVPSGLAAVLFATFPLFVALIAHFALPGERLTARAAAGMVVGFGGVALVFAEDFSALGGPQVAVASAVMLLSPLVSAIGQIAVKRWGGGAHPVPLNVYGMLLCSAVIGAVAAIAERGRPMRFDSAAVGSVLYLAIVGTAVAFTLYFWLLKHMSATRLSLTAYFIPIVAVVVGAVVFDERLTPLVALGALLVIAGTALTGSAKKPPRA
jgi:drug/metabolite transporter (DMT)-like permease